MSQKSILWLSELKDTPLECEIETQPIYGFKKSFSREVPEETVALGIKSVKVNFKGTWLDVTDLVPEETLAAMEAELDQ